MTTDRRNSELGRRTMRQSFKTKAALAIGAGVPLSFALAADPGAAETFADNSNDGAGSIDAGWNDSGFSFDSGFGFGASERDNNRTEYVTKARPETDPVLISLDEDRLPGFDYWAPEPTAPDDRLTDAEIDQALEDAADLYVRLFDLRNVQPKPVQDASPQGSSTIQPEPAQEGGGARDFLPGDELSELLAAHPGSIEGNPYLDTLRLLEDSSSLTTHGVEVVTKFDDKGNLTAVSPTGQEVRSVTQLESDTVVPGEQELVTIPAGSLQYEEKLIGTEDQNPGGRLYRWVSTDGRELASHESFEGASLPATELVARRRAWEEAQRVQLEDDRDFAANVLPARGVDPGPTDIETLEDSTLVEAEPSFPRPEAVQDEADIETIVPSAEQDATGPIVKMDDPFQGSGNRDGDSAEVASESSEAASVIESTSRLTEADVLDFLKFLDRLEDSLGAANN